MPSDIQRVFREQAGIELQPALSPSSPAAQPQAARPPMFVLLDRGHHSLQSREFFGLIREARRELRWQQPRARHGTSDPESTAVAYDCDDFSIALRTFFAKAALERRMQLPYCLGIVGCLWLNQAAGYYQSHVLCWTLLWESGALRLWFIDPQQRIRWDTDDWLSKKHNLCDPMSKDSQGRPRYKDHFLVMI